MAQEGDCRPVTRGWTLGHVDRSDGFPRVDWDAVLPRIFEEVPVAGQAEACTSAAREWLGDLRSALGPGYRLAESQDFLVVTALDDSSTTRLLGFLEGARKRILVDLLPGVAGVPGVGKHAAVVIQDRDAYTSYIDYFYREGGRYPATGGVYLEGSPRRPTRWVYGHFALLAGDLPQAERVVAHELTHNCLRHLPLPSWLDEGLATTIEAVIMEDPPLVLRGEDRIQLRETFGGGRVQEFWTGWAPHRPDDRARLSYLLARAMVKTLSSDLQKFRRFALQARKSDTGEAAARAVFGAGVGGVVSQILGPGDWEARPETWTRIKADEGLGGMQ